jgi:cobalt-zinc-cadmium efflux system membrane fusion protein
MKISNSSLLSSAIARRARAGGLILSFAALVMLMAAGCKAKQETPAAAAAEQLNAGEVAITPALKENLKFGYPEMADVIGTLQVAARVQTNAKQIAHVGSPVKGRILKLLVFEGQHVTAGTVLATLHSTELSDTQFALVKAASQQNLAAAAEKRAEQLVHADVIGRAELERRGAELLQATTEADSYHTQLLGLAGHDGGADPATGNDTQAERRLRDHRAENGDGSQTRSDDRPGGAAGRSGIYDCRSSAVWIVANAPEEDAGQLQEGMQVEVRIPALPTQEITGRLSFVSPIVDPATRTVEVHMDVPNPKGLLKPDELASMTFTGQKERKLTVPVTAVVREENKDYVFVEIGPTKYVLREVTLGQEENDRRVVLSGVRQEERTVTDGAFHLNNQRKQIAIKGGE